MRSVSRLLLTLSTFALVSACSSGDPGTTSDGESPDGGTTSTEAEPVERGSGSAEDLEQSAAEHFEAFVAKDGETWFAMLSHACRERLGFAVVDGHIDGRHFRSGLNGIDVSSLTVADVMVSGGGSEAQVTLEIDGTTATFREALPQRWIFEEGGWRMDDCSDIGEGRGQAQLDDAGKDRNDPLELGFAADISGWLVAVTYVTSDAEELVVELGGSPAAEGNEVFNVQFNLSYQGPEPSLILGDELEFAMVNGDTVYGDEANCGSDDPAFIDPEEEFQPGPSGSLYFVCREVASEHVTDLLLRITHVPTDDNRWWTLAEG